MQVGSIEPGDATHYRYAFEKLEDGSLYFAFNSGYSDVLFGNFWHPANLGYISLGYFSQQMGGDKVAQWTLGVAYLALHSLLGRELDEQDKSQGVLEFITPTGRMKEGWLNPFPSQY